MGLENLFSGTNTQDIAHPIAWLPAGLYGQRKFQTESQKVKQETGNGMTLFSVEDIDRSPTSSVSFEVVLFV
ncbi:hypothetical protein OUZ56_014056 [Daphnia magna]|uniref:Uncharacterized protein n=1 Tax=Daphnia magna TaxID=35525 RepID=A0ABQ9Z8V5_9CRUS|nr:hypothetical protein OUZ56_014056 [Daphnia magna]